MSDGPAARLRRRPRRATSPDVTQQAARLRQRIPHEFAPHLDLGGAKAWHRTQWTIARQLRDLTGPARLLPQGATGNEPSWAGPRALTARRHQIARRMAPLLDLHPELLITFGAASPYELAQIVLDVELALRRGIGTRTTRELAARGSARTGGLFGDVAGRLVEVAAFRHRAIHAQLTDDARAVLDLVIARGTHLKTLDGSVILPRTFSGPERATRIYTVVRDAQGRITARDEFVDFIYLSHTTSKGMKSGAAPEYTALPLLGDVKVPGQVRKAGGKFRDALGRLHDCTELELEIDGRMTPTVIPRERLLVLPDDLRHAVISTAEAQKGPGYTRRFRRESDGTLVPFPVLGIDLKMAAIYKLTRLMLQQ